MSDHAEKEPKDLRKPLLQKHHDLALRCDRARGEFEFVDAFFAGSLRRSFWLTCGFFDLVQVRNYTAAAPLVRLELDTGFRTAALGWVDDPRAFVSEVVAGTPIATLRDATGRLMNDRYLCERLSDGYPWILDVYRAASGSIHFSDQHLAAAVVAHPRNEFSYRLDDTQDFASLDAYAQLTKVFVVATTMVLDFVKVWAEILERRNQKQHPQ